MANESALSLEAQVHLQLQRAAQQWNTFQRTNGTFKPVLDKSRFGASQLTADISRLDKSLVSATNRVTSLGAAFTVFFGIQRAFASFIKSTIDVEASLTRINVNLGQSSQGLQEFSKGLFDIARLTGRTFDEAAKAAEEFARQGLSVAEVQKRTRDALVLARIAAIDVGEATTDLTAAVNTFNAEALTTTDIVNRLAAVDTRFAVSSRDLGLAISRVGNSAQEAGVSFNELLGIVTAVQQTTQRGGSVIGNSLKTIFTRISRPGVLDQLEELGVATRDLNNNTLPAIQILQNLSATYDKLSSAQKSVLAEQVGGVYQINILKAAVKDLGNAQSVAAEATLVAANAQDAAFQKNAELNKTLQASIAGTANSIKELFASIGNQSVGVGLKPLLAVFDEARQTLSGGDTGEGMGKTIGEGIVKGISNVLSGPVLIGGVIAITKGLFTILKAFSTSLRAELGLKTVTEQRAAVLARINELIALANGSELRSIANATSILGQRQALLAIEQRISAEKARQVVTDAALASSFLQPGLRGGVVSGLNVKKAAEGYVPSSPNAPKTHAADGYLPALAQEKAAVSKGVGGASASARAVVIPNFAFGQGKRGALVANTDEYIVPNYANTGASAIFNPKMVQKYGLPEGAQKITSGTAAAGFVPSFAKPQTDSEAFKRFFAGSKVTNAKGGPLSVFHGSVATGIKVFDPQAKAVRKRTGPDGTYFTSDVGSAVSYTRAPGKSNGKRGELTEAFLSLKNPLDITTEIKLLTEQGVPFSQAKAKALQKLDPSKHDGVIFRGNDYNPDEYVAFRPEQIKSATRNRGTFDPTNPDITAAHGHIPSAASGTTPANAALSRAAVKAPSGVVPNFANTPFSKYLSAIDPSYLKRFLELEKKDPKLGEFLRKAVDQKDAKAIHGFQEYLGGKHVQSTPSAYGLDTTTYFDLDDEPEVIRAKAKEVFERFKMKSPFDNAARGLIPNFAGPMGLRRGALQVGEGVFGRALKSPDPINVDGSKTSVMFKDFKPDGEKEALIRREYAISQLSRELGLPVARVYGSAKRSADRGGLYKEFIDGTRGDKLPPHIREPVESALRNQFRDKGITPFDLRGPNYVVKKGANLDDVEDVIRNAIVVDPGGFESMDTSKRWQYNKHYYSKAEGHIPNLAQALTREARAGVDPRSIYVDRDPRVKSAGNPEGLLVANRRDEPRGGYQGVDRVIRQGGNPRTAGALRGAAGGFIPSFAAEQTPGQKQNIYQNFLQGNIIQPADVQSEVSEATESRRRALAAQRAKEIDLAYAQLEKEKALSKSKTALTEAEITRAERALGATQRIYGKARERGASLGLEREQTKLPDTFYANQAIRGLGGSFATGPKATAEQMAALSRASQARSAPIVQNRAGESGNITPNEGPTNAERKARSSALQGSPLATDINAAQRLAAEREAFQRASIERQRKIAFDRIVSRRQGGANITPAQQRLVAQEFEEQGRASAKTRFAPGARPEAIRGYVKDYVNSKLGALGIDKNGLRNLTPPKESLSTRAGNFLRGPSVGIGLAIGAPLAAGFVPQGKGGTAGGVAGGAASGALQGVGIGAIFGPVGIAVGAASGALVGAFSNLRKSVSEFSAELAETTDKEKETQSQLGEFVQLQQQYIEAFASGDSNTAERVAKRRDEVFSKSTPETQALINGAGGERNLKGLIEALDKQSGKVGSKELSDNVSNVLKDITNSFFNASDKKLDNAARGISTLAASQKIDLSKLDIAFESVGDRLKRTSGTNVGGAGGQIAQVLGTDITKLQALFTKLGATVDVSSLSFDELVTILKRAIPLNKEQIVQIEKSSRVNAQMTASLQSNASFIREGRMRDFDRSTSFQGAQTREAFAEESQASVQEGRLTTNGVFDLRAGLQRSQAEREEKSARNEAATALGEQIRELLKKQPIRQDSASVFGQAENNSQRQKALGGKMSPEELISYAKLELADNGSELKKAEEDYMDVLKRASLVRQQSIETINANNQELRKATEQIRRQSAFSNYSREQGAQVGMSLRGFGDTKGVGKPFQEKQDDAFLDFLKVAESSQMAIPQALKDLQTSTQAKVNERSLLDLAKNVFSGLNLPGFKNTRFEKPDNTLDGEALKRAGQVASKSADPRTAAIGETFLKAFEAQKLNSVDAKVTSGALTKDTRLSVNAYAPTDKTKKSNVIVLTEEDFKRASERANRSIGGGEGKPYRLDSADYDRADKAKGTVTGGLKDATKAEGGVEEISRRGLESMQALKDAFESLATKQTDFSLNLKSQVEVTIANADTFLSKDSAQAFQNEITTTLEQGFTKVWAEIAKLKGTPNPPAARGAR